MQMQVAAGFYDFLVTLACFAVAAVSLYILMEMYFWLKGDIPTAFSKFFEIAEKALRINQG